MSWMRGRLLASYKSCTFSYTADGERFHKNSGSSSVQYNFINGKLIREDGTNRTIIYLYGANGITGCVINGTNYYYVKNLFGDVIELRNTTDNTLAAKYVYDAWGNHKVYDANGVRTSKTITQHGSEVISCKYIYDGNNLIAEQRGTAWIYYIYGADGISGFRYNNETYLYRKNAQGDITHIYTKDGVLVARYAYDAWGNIKILQGENGIATVNPFRYRGYYYDSETGLYYLQTRYYDPEVGRFISADSIEYLDPETLGGLNLYAYCGNNPVMNVDPNGTWDWSAFWQGVGRIALGIGAVIAGALVLASGVAGIAMLAVAAVTFAAGVATTVNGVAGIGEAATGYNFVRDWMFNGNEKAYNIFSTVTDTVSYVGSIVCGGWLKANGPRIKAYKNINNYSPSDTISDTNHMSRPYQQSTLLQKQIIKYGKMIDEGNGIYKFIVNGSYRIGFDGNVHSGITWKLVVDIINKILFHFGPF